MSMHAPSSHHGQHPLLPPWELAAEVLRCLSYLPAAVGWQALCDALALPEAANAPTAVPPAVTWQLWPRLHLAAAAGPQLVRPLALVEGPGTALLLETDYGEDAQALSERIRRAEALVAQRAAAEDAGRLPAVGLITTGLRSPVGKQVRWCGLSELLGAATRLAALAQAGPGPQRCLGDALDRLAARGAGGPAGLARLPRLGWEAAGALRALRTWDLSEPFRGFVGLPPGPHTHALAWDPLGTTDDEAAPGAARGES